MKKNINYNLAKWTWKEYPQSPWRHEQFIFLTAHWFGAFVSLHSKCKYSINHWINPRRSMCEKGRVSVWKHHTNRSVPWMERTGSALLKVQDAIWKLYSEWMNQRSSIQPGGLLMTGERKSINKLCLCSISICRFQRSSGGDVTMLSFTVEHSLIFRSWLNKQTIFNMMENFFFFYTYIHTYTGASQ